MMPTAAASRNTFYGPRLTNQHTEETDMSKQMILAALAIATLLNGHVDCGSR